MERTVRVDIGLVIADAELVELGYGRDRSLRVVFETGVFLPDYLVEVMFTNAVAFRLQEAEYSIDGNDRCDDFVYEVLDSAWLALHRQQNYVDAEVHLRHFKFSFAGSSPTLEVLCGAVSKRKVNGWRSARIAGSSASRPVRVGVLCGWSPDHRHGHTGDPERASALQPDTGSGRFRPRPPASMQTGSCGVRISGPTPGAPPIPAAPRRWPRPNGRRFRWPGERRHEQG